MRIKATSTRIRIFLKAQLFSWIRLPSRSPKTELFEDGLRSGTFRKRRFPVLVWTRIFLKTDKKKLRFQTKTDTCGQSLRSSGMSLTYKKK